VRLDRALAGLPHARGFAFVLGAISCVRVCVWFWQGGDKIVLAASQCHDIEEQIKKTHAIPSIASSALSGKIYDAPGAAGGGEGSGGGGGGSARQKGAA